MHWCCLNPMLLIASYGYHAGVEALLNANSDIKVQDTYGATALHYAVPKRHLFVTELLLAAGANTSLVDRDDQMAFDLSLARDHRDVCQVMLKHMCSPSVLETEHSLHVEPKIQQL